MGFSGFQRLLTVLSFLFAASACWAWQFDMGSYSKWFQGVQLPQETLTPLKHYFTQDSAEEIKIYGDKVLATYKQTLSAFVSNLQNGKTPSCETSVNLNFDKNLTKSPQANAQSFEAELLQIDAVACLPSFELEKTVELFYSDDFQLKYIDGLKTSQSDETTNTVCQTTKVFGVGNSNFCSRYSFWRNQSTVIAFSVNVKNDVTASGPVYLRLVTTVFHKIQDGRILVYNLTYGRGPNLPLHSLVKSVAGKQQKTLMSALANELK